MRGSTVNRGYGAACALIICEGTAVTRGLCNKHYLRFRRYGDPLGGKRERVKPAGWTPPATDDERLVRNREARARWRDKNRDVQRTHRQAYKARKLGQFVEHVRLRTLVERDRSRCGICNCKVKPAEYSIDHILPLSYGGDHSYANTRLTHLVCNTTRKNRGAAQLRLAIDVAA